MGSEFRNRRRVMDAAASILRLPRPIPCPRLIVYLMYHCIGFKYAQASCMSSTITHADCEGHTNRVCIRYGPPKSLVTSLAPLFADKAAW